MISPENVKFKNYSENDLIKKVREEVEKAVESTLESVSNKNFGVFISGGIDSTTMVHYLSKHYNKTIKTFSMGFGEETDEISDAEVVAERYETKHRKIIVSDIMKDFPKLIQYMGYPKRNLWGYYLANFASKYVNVIFDGLGGDELFGGYTFRYQHALKMPHKTSLDKIKAYVQAAHIRDFIHGCKIFGPKFKGISKKIIYEPFIKYFNNDLEFLDQIFIADLNIKCRYDFFPLNRMNEVNGLDVKFPWFSPNLVKFAFTVPHSFKYNKGIGKYILKKAFKGLIPERSIQKKKQGFGPNPLNVWRNNLKDYLKEYLLNGETVKDGYINGDYIERIIDSPISEKMIPHYNKLWDALAFEIWYELFKDGKL